MKALGFILSLRDPQCNWRYRYCGLVPGALVLCLIYFIIGFLISPGHRESLLFQRVAYTDTVQNSMVNKCDGGETGALPKGIISGTTDYELRPLWGVPKRKKESDSMNLFAVAAGIKQKDIVDKMVRKFLASNFTIILFHYDGNVDDWKSLEWSDQAIHVSAKNQTKWWFAKRFLHPDIVTEYRYIFLWDEDLGIENFDPARYVSIVQTEGLEISQPALDQAKSTEIHHQITARGRRSTVHRRVYKAGGKGKGCDGDSKGPPCTGWIEMMAPVFSRAAWRCVWYMIQNDLIHAWGLDIQLGYCAQGDRTKNVGVVDTEYIAHLGRPTLGGADHEEASSSSPAEDRTSTQNDTSQPTHSLPKDHRYDVRKQSYIEHEIFKNRWRKAVQEDKCWVDPYQ